MEPSILMNLTRSRILHMLATDGPATPADISSALSLAMAVVHQELGQLASAGFVRASGPQSAHPYARYKVDMPQIVQEMAQVRQLLGFKVE